MNTYDDGRPDPVGAEFLAYRERLFPEVHPAGTAAVRRTVRRRRRLAVAVVAAVILTGVAVPVAALAMFDGRRAAPEPGTDLTPTPPAPSTPAPTPSTTPGTSPTATPPPNGRISRAQLLAAAVDVPEWPPSTDRRCGTKGIRLHDRWTRPSIAVLGALRYGDVDRDGAPETVAAIACTGFEEADQQIVAFDRDGTGRIVVLGRVVANGNGVAGLGEFRVDPDGGVRVRLCLAGCPSDPVNEDERGQWRTYRWTGTGFHQTGGPTSFPIRPTAPPPGIGPLTISATDLTYGPPDGTGTRHGATTVTITNPGPKRVEYPMITIPTDSRHEAEHIEWSGYRVLHGGKSKIVLVAHPLPPGEERSFTLSFSTRVSGPPSTATMRVEAGESIDGPPVTVTGDETTFKIIFES